MIYVLDTDILSLLAHEDAPEAPRIRRRIAETPSQHAIVTTIINYEEQMRGWISALAKAKSPKAELPIYSRLVSHVDAYRRMKIVPFEEAAFEQMESFRQHLQIEDWSKV